MVTERRDRVVLGCGAEAECSCLSAFLSGYNATTLTSAQSKTVHPYATDSPEPSTLCCFSVLQAHRPLQWARAPTRRSHQPTLRLLAQSPPLQYILSHTSCPSFRLPPNACLTATSVVVSLRIQFIISHLPSSTNHLISFLSFTTHSS